MNYLEAISLSGRNANPFFCLMDIDIISYGDGKAELVMPVRKDMRNGEGWLQGGMYTALADEAMALAVYTLLSDGESVGTISETTSYMRAVREGTIYAQARVIRRGRAVIFAEAVIKEGNEGRKELARCGASFFVRST